ncbi:MAG TPA: glucosaminidase domain-containing protein [Ktedonobacteraceae bacterium]|jgi:hypothetical protein|nr:glucosaminidase domain-containing protein [Ktedonobacteraceae bacterium]
MHNQEPTEGKVTVPLRATRQLPVLSEVEELHEEKPGPGMTRTLSFLQPKEKITAVLHTNQIVVNEFPVHPLARHMPWMRILLVSMCVGVIFIGVLSWSAISQRSGGPQLIGYFGGKSYSIQVGGQLVNTWQTPQAVPPKVPIPIKTGPYSVLGRPTVTAAFINEVLASYHSPAAGKGQALYDLGIKYGIDPVFALAFFMHESTFGTRGEAAITMSLGNLRCINSRPCVNTQGTPCQAGQSCYAQFSSWEDGFEIWYQLIRNLYVTDWGATTVDLIIPHYAPAADHNNETAYINSLKLSISTWRAGVVRVG